MTVLDAGARRRIDRHTPDCLSEREWTRDAASVSAAITEPAIAAHLERLATAGKSGKTLETITVPGDVTPKVRQRLPWGSPESATSFKRRALVEGAFGNLKNPHTENVRRGWTNVVGIVKTSLMLAIAQAVANLRLLQVWARRTGDYADALTLPDPEDHGFEEIDLTRHPQSSEVSGGSSSHPVGGSGTAGSATAAPPHPNSRLPLHGPQTIA